MYKPFTCSFPEGTAEYVKLHGDWRKEQGLEPVAIITGFENYYSAAECYSWACRNAYFPVNGEYLKGFDTSFYACSKCGASGCKLWRDSGFFSFKLFCGICAQKGREKGSPLQIPDEKGMFDWYCNGEIIPPRTDQINGKLPAVPTEDGNYWGYTSVPNPALNWWYSLPSVPDRLKFRFR